MEFEKLTAPEARVLGCLIEKRLTTPDQYPLSVNALRLACNQSTNRDPVVGYDESTVRAAAQRLCRYGLARLASGHTSRAIKYRHLVEDALGLDRAQSSALAVLMLRGAQTPGEIKQRTERMASLPSLEAVEGVLEALIEHGYAERLERRPGQKEERYASLLEAPGEQATSGERPVTDNAGRGADSEPAAEAGFGGTPTAEAGFGATPSAEAATDPSEDGSTVARIEALERTVGSLAAELADLRRRLD